MYSPHPVHFSFSVLPWSHCAVTQTSTLPPPPHLRFLQCLYRIPIEEAVRDELLVGSAAGNAEKASEAYKRLRKIMVRALDPRFVGK